MKPFFTEIFDYHHHFNQELITQLREIRKQLPERTIPLFSHTINAHQIWNARITSSETVGVLDVHSLAALREMDKSNHGQTLIILETRSLDEKVTYSNSKGTPFENTVRDILFHVANHFTHHKGQVLSDIRASGNEPLVTDYIFYKRG